VDRRAEKITLNSLSEGVTEKGERGDLFVSEEQNFAPGGGEVVY